MQSAPEKFLAQNHLAEQVTRLVHGGELKFGIVQAEGISM